MPKKLTDFNKDVRQDMRDVVNAGAVSLGQDAYAHPTEHVTANKLGMCSDCVYLNRILTEYGRVYAYCTEFKVPLKGIDPVKECTTHAKRGVMTLNEMQDVAHIIEVNNKQIGFIE